MIEWITEVFKGYGLIGAVAFLLLLTVYKLFNMYVCCQEEKLKLLKESLETLGPLTAAIRDLSDTQRRFMEKLEDATNARRR